MHPFRGRKQPPSGLREEEVPYLIISSHSEKHTAQGFCAAAGVGFPLAGAGLQPSLPAAVEIIPLASPADFLLEDTGRMGCHGEEGGRVVGVWGEKEG
ncbi:hypothetical protein KUCAC02_028565, partial [Chaenocephalus aceratus]